MQIFGLEMSLFSCLHANEIKNNFGDKIFQRGSIYFKHICTGGSKYFDIVGQGNENKRFKFFVKVQMAGQITQPSGKTLFESPPKFQYCLPRR